MAQVPETRPVAMDRSLKPANDIQPQVGVYYDSAGNPQRAYMLAPPPPGYVGSTGGTEAPSSFVAVTPSDTTALPTGMQGLWVGGAGNLYVKGLNDSAAVALLAVPAGTLIRGQFSRVMSTGPTTATNIVALI